MQSLGEGRRFGPSLNTPLLTLTLAIAAPVSVFRAAFLHAAVSLSITAVSQMVIQSAIMLVCHVAGLRRRQAAAARRRMTSPTGDHGVSGTVRYPRV